MFERSGQVGGGILAVRFESGGRAGQIRRLLGLSGFHCIKVVGQGFTDGCEIVHLHNLA